MTGKLPLPPSAAHLRDAVDPAITRFETGNVVWRVHRTVGEHVLPWNALRRYGPVVTCRWDPHPPPPRMHADVGVSYLAVDVPTALAEAFQQHRRVINVGRGRPYLTGFLFTRPLRLLDLTDMWPLHAGASHSINTGRKDVTRAWARALTEAWPTLDGLYSTSSLSSRPCVTVFGPAADAFPAAPQFSEPLTHPALQADLSSAAWEIGYRIVLSS